MGNRIGSKDSLQYLCEEAGKNGLVVIADAVVNHLASTDNTGSLDPHPRCDEDLIYNWDSFKEKRNVENWDDRYQVTHYCMSLPGLNPNSRLVQRKVIDMLNEYIKLGVSGFRFDAAKSIALPDEGCDFFPNITYSMDKWLAVVYGEVLFADKDLIQRYAKYMKVLTNSDAYNHNDIVKFVENQDSYLSKDLGWTRNVSIYDINRWYSDICRTYPNTLYYARNYTDEWNAWRSNYIRSSNMQLKLKK